MKAAIYLSPGEAEAYHASEPYRNELANIAHNLRVRGKCEVHLICREWGSVVLATYAALPLRREPAPTSQRKDTLPSPVPVFTPPPFQAPPYQAPYLAKEAPRAPSIRTTHRALPEPVRPSSRPPMTVWDHIQDDEEAPPTPRALTDPPPSDESQVDRVDPTKLARIKLRRVRG